MPKDTRLNTRDNNIRHRAFWSQHPEIVNRLVRRLDNCSLWEVQNGARALEIHT